MDAWFERTFRNGGTPTIRPADAFFGDRYRWLTEPLTTTGAGSVKEVLTPDPDRRADTARLRGYSHACCPPDAASVA